MNQSINESMNQSINEINKSINNSIRTPNDQTRGIPPQKYLLTLDVR
jgi:hypothetical protein